MLEIVYTHYYARKHATSIHSVPLSLVPRHESIWLFLQQMCLIDLTCSFLPSQFKGFIGVVISNNEFNSSSGRITLSKLTRTECYNNDKLKKRLHTERTHEYAGMQSHVGIELFLQHWAGCGYGFALKLHHLKTKMQTIDLSKPRDSDVAVPNAQAKWDKLSTEDKEMWEAGEIPTQAKLTRQDKGNVSGHSQATIRAEAASEMQVTGASEMAVRLVPTGCVPAILGDSRYCPAALDVVRKVERGLLT